MSNYSGTVVEYLDDQHPALAYVLDESKGNLHVVGEGGRRGRIPLKRVLVRHSIGASVDTFPEKARELTAQIEQWTEEVDIKLLWESVDDQQETTLEALAHLYFDSDDSIGFSAILRALLQDNGLYFSRKGTAFVRRTSEQVQAQQVARERAREREEQRRESMEWLRSILQSESVPVPIPDAMIPVVEDLERFLAEKESNAGSNLLAEVADREDLREAAFDVLRTTGRIAADAEPLLVISGIRTEFPEDVLREAASLRPFSEMEGRADFTHLSAFTIDDETTRDMDDALTVEQVLEGVRAGIHIADVPFFVNPETALDRHALQRGLSVYIPTRTIPMFPERLAHDLASLNQDALRPTLSFLVTFDAEGEVIDSQIVRGAIRSKRRMTYDQVDAILESDAENRETAELRLLQDLSRKLVERRLANGAILIRRPELKISVRDDEIRLSVIDADTPARRIVGEMMVLANELAARYAHEQGVPMIYRTQDPPENQELAGRRIDYDPALMETLLRGMHRSRYSTHPEPHSGLGLDAYTQISSPIRRYADLVLQRQIMAHLARREPPHTQNELFQVLATAENAEREARSVENQAKRYWALRYLERRRRNDSFDAVVVGERGGGYLLEMTEYGLRGILPTQLQQETGDRLRVAIADINPERDDLRFNEID